MTLKLYERYSNPAKQEIEAYDHLKSLRSNYTGAILVRTVLHKFQLLSIDGSHFHRCLIHSSLAMGLFELPNRAARKVLPGFQLKPTLIHILIALDFLHHDGHMIHTGSTSSTVTTKLYTSV